MYRIISYELRHMNYNLSFGQNNANTIHVHVYIYTVDEKNKNCVFMCGH